MISEIIQPEKRDTSYEFDLPVMVVHNRDPNLVAILHEFFQDDGNFCYHGYYLYGESFKRISFFQPVSIYDNDIENWSKFKGKVVLSNFAENE